MQHIACLLLVANKALRCHRGIVCCLSLIQGLFCVATVCQVAAVVSDSPLQAEIEGMLVGSREGPDMASQLIGGAFEQGGEALPELLWRPERRMLLLQCCQDAAGP